MFHKEIETISFSDMSIYTRDAIKVSSLIFGVLYEDFDRSSSESMMNQIKDYSLLKCVFASCSIKSDTKKVITISIFNSILKELKANSKIKQLLNNSDINPYSTNKISDLPLSLDNDYLSRILSISICEVHISLQSIKCSNDNKYKQNDIDKIMEKIETLISQNSSKSRSKCQYCQDCPLIHKNSNRKTILECVDQTEDSHLLSSDSSK